MSQVRKTLVSNCEKQFLIKCLAKYNRLDGRAFDEFRELKIDFDKDWGCCFVSLGKTRVVAQVSCEVQQPKSSRPSEGILNVNLELNTIAAPHFESGRQSDYSVQLNRLLEKCLKDSKAVDLESLCIKMNEKVWSLRVDINVLNHEGNILDCASVAALASLAHFRRPDVTCDGEEFIIHTYKQRDPIPTVIHHYPVCVTYALVNEGEYILADPTLLEEGTTEAFLTVSLNAYRELCGLHLGGKINLTPNLIIQTTEKAAARAVFVVKEIKEAVERDSLKRKNEESIGFHLIYDDMVQKEPVVDLSVCLDSWKKVGKKSKSKENSNKEKPMDKLDNKMKVDGVKTEIHTVAEGSATLIEKGISNEVWVVSSSEEDNDVIEIKPNVETINVSDYAVDSDDSSEEERVVVLNANMKTNKRKKK